MAGETIRRGYAGGALKVWKEGGRRRRRPLTADEWLVIWEPVRAKLKEDLELELASEVRIPLERAAQMSPERLKRDSVAFREIYGRLGIIPPDAYLALPLQIETGCPYGKCAFCDFYDDRPFRLRGLDEFQHHISAVVDYFGAALAMRKGVFLADADALAAPDDLLFPALEAIHERFPGESITCFAGPGMRKGRSEDTYRRAGALGLSRVHVGVESGSAQVLELLGKPSTTKWWREQVLALASAGVSLGLIVLVGAGGEGLSRKHLQDTVDAFRQLPLGRDDIIYLSPLIAEPGGAFHEHLTKSGSRPFDDDEVEAELERFRDAFQGWRGPRPRVARYDIRDFLS